MLKKILLFIVPVLALAILIAGVIFFQPDEDLEINAIDAIPQSSSLLIKNDFTTKTWRKISETNIIWEELLSTESAQHLNTLFSNIDSALQSNPEISNLLENQTLWLSFHQTEQNQTEFLFAITVGNSVSEKDLIRFFETHNDETYTLQQHQETSIHNSPSISYAVHHGILVFSPSLNILKESIAQISSGASILNDPSFQQIWETKGDYSDANVFVNYTNFPKLVNTLIQEPYYAITNNTGAFSSWSEMDLSIKPNSLAFNGFSYSSDSLNQFLNVFDGQKAEHFEFIKVLPSNTATFFHYGLSNFEAFINNYKKYLTTLGHINDYNNHIQQLEEKYRINVNDHLFSWIENEVAVAITEPADQDFEDGAYVILKTNNLEQANKEIKALISAVNASTEDETEVINHKGYTIQQIKIPGLFETLFGELFSSVTENYFVEIDNYFIFGNSASALRSIVNSYLSDRTLANDENFDAYRDNISSESNLFIYSNIARSVYLYEHFTNEKLTQEIDQHLELYRKFEAFSLQVSNENNNLFYHNLFVKHNPVYKQESTSLWEVELDTTVIFKPTLVTNHYTQALEIVVQDEKNNLYLISNTGKILWKKQLPEKIMGTVEQVDVFKNDKLQLTFNTKNRLYVIDRLGRDVEGFPIKLPSPASAPMTILDYNKSRDYRFLIPARDKKIYNYDRKGKVVKGWKHEAGEAPINHPIHYFVVNKKDYILAVDSLGNVTPLDRRGRIRIPLKKQLKLAPNTTFFVEEGKNIKQSRIVGTDEKGNVISLYFNDNFQSMNFHPYSGNHHFEWADIDNDANLDYVFADGRILEVYNQEQELLFQMKFDTTITAGPNLYSFSNATKIGITLGSLDEIYLINKNGNIGENFPMHGNSAFSIADINKDGKFELIVCGLGGKVYTYMLQ